MFELMLEKDFVLVLGLQLVFELRYLLVFELESELRYLLVFELESEFLLV